MKNQDDVRINEQIEANEVRLVDNEGNQYGIVSIKEALEKAHNKNLDLVEIAPDAEPPVCKIIDWDKERYRLRKQAQASKSKQHTVQVKELQLRPVTDSHDIDIKVNRAKQFLEKGNKVKFIMKFHGREITHSDAGMEIMKKIIADLGDVTVERSPAIAGRDIQMVLARSEVKK